MKRFLILGASVLALGGCALPVPLQVASWALDGLLYVTTEKSAADHGLSMIAQQDCAVLRGVLTDGHVCRPIDDAETLVVDAAGASDAPSGPGVGSGAVTAALTSGSPDDIQALANFETAAGDPKDVPAAAELKSDPRLALDLALDLPGEIVVTFDAFGDPMQDYPQVVGPSANKAGARTVVLRDDADFEAGVGFAGFQTAAEVAEETAARIELAEDGTVVTDGIHESGPALKSKTQGTRQGAAQGAEWRAVATPASMVAGTGGEPQAGFYFVIGSFRQHDNARELRKRYAALTPAVLAAEIDGGTVFRVVVGPFDIGQAKRVHQRIFEAGISDSWAIRVRPGEWSMAMVDPPAVAPEVAALALDERASAWNPMTYVRKLVSLIY